MLRDAGPDIYDQWVNHEIPFNDPPVAEALDPVGGILKNDDYVNGGFGDVNSIATTEFQEAGLPILDGKCALHRQASFYAANWPEGTEVTEDGDVFAFYLPLTSEEFGKPVLGGGEFVTAFSDRPEVQAFQTYLSTDVWANEKAQGHAERRLGQRQHRPGRSQPGQPDRQAVGGDPPGPRGGLPLRRLRPDAQRRRRRDVLEADDLVGHR